MKSVRRTPPRRCMLAALVLLIALTGSGLGPARRPAAAAVPGFPTYDAARTTLAAGPRGAPASPEGLSPTPNWFAEGNDAGCNFGFAVSTAGDVNGDGYADVIVGAHTYNNGSTVGMASAYYGSAAGLSPTPNWFVLGDVGVSAFGYAVSTAGDVNGDGYADVIVGAYEYDNDQAGEGRAYVYHGSAAGLSPTPNWIAEGNQPFALFGLAVSTAGDVNGDGYADVVVTAIGYDNDQANEGAALIYHGSASGLPPSPNTIIEGNLADGYFGYDGSTAGDVNGDGYADVIVSDPYYDNGQTDEGRVCAYHGSAAGASTTPSWCAEGDHVAANLGWSVSTAGDVNGDGYADVIASMFSSLGHGARLYPGSAAGLNPSYSWIAGRGVEAVGPSGDVDGDGYADVVVGNRGYTNGQNAEGGAFLYPGSAAGPAAAPTWMAEGEQSGAYLGEDVATAGDVNGDGYADVIVGAAGYDNDQTGEGRAYVYHGSGTGLAAAAGWAIEGDQESVYLGGAVATAGDVNGDGYADVVVGAFWYDNDQVDEGRAYLYHGSAAGLAPTPGWSAEGDQANAYLGLSAAAAGDVNGDGYGDVVVGAPGYDNDQVDEGRALLYYGAPGGLSPNPGWTAEGDQAHSGFGRAVAAAGDVNGDGYGDVIVGADLCDNGLADEGCAFVYYGAPGGLSPTPNWSAAGAGENARFGAAVAAAGDVNGDGYADVVVGAPAYDNDQAEEGRAYLYHGSAAGLSPTPSWVVESDQAGAALGHAVAAAGDVNGDGYSDVIVGADLYDNGQADEGRAYLYHGSAAGLFPAPAWTAEGDQAAAWFGGAAAAAGDVNGDGYADVVVGAALYDNGQADEGRAYLYHGSAGGLPSAPTWTAEGEQDWAWFGYAGAAAGDANGDGYADVVVGAPQYDNGQADEGRAVLYYGNGGDGVPLAPRQRRAGDGAPVAHEGMSEQPTSFRLAARGISPLGAGWVKLQWEVKPLGVLFDGTGLQEGGAWLGSGAAGAALNELVGGLSAGTSYHWRVRLLYHPGTTPFQQRSRWLAPPWGGWNETQLRTAHAADLALVKSDTPDPVYAGGALTYTLAVVNAGPDAAVSVILTDTLPAGAGFVSAEGSGWTCAHNGGTVVCARAGLPAGASSITIRVAAPPASGTITNSAVVRSATYDGNPADNGDTEPTAVLASADLALAKDDTPDPVATGGALTYTLGVDNAGPTAAAPVTVTDILPAGVAYAGAGGSGWTCGEAGGVITCVCPSLGLGPAPQIVITGNAPGTAGTIANTAVVTSATGDPDPGNNNAAAATVVQEPVAGLSAANDSPTALGSPTALTATVTAGSSLLYAWDLGDGAAGSGATLSHVYPYAGTYTAIVTASNGVSLLAAATEVTVEGPCAPISATDFFWSPPAPQAGAVVTFTGSAAGSPPLTYTWSWGDGTLGNGAVATHVYAAAGVYTVALTATNPCGQGTRAGGLEVYPAPTTVWAVYLPLIRR